MAIADARDTGSGGCPRLAGKTAPTGPNRFEPPDLPEFAPILSATPTQKELRG